MERISCVRVLKSIVWGFRETIGMWMYSTVSETQFGERSEEADIAAE